MKKIISLLLVLLLSLGVLVACGSNDGSPQTPPSSGNEPEEEVRETIDRYSGEGTQESPYLIKNADDLIYLATITNDKSDPKLCKGLYFRLEADIDLNQMEWLPIGGFFCGNFDGNGHTISNFKLTNATKADQVVYTYQGPYGIQNKTTSLKSIGLFGNLRDASVSNLTISNCNILIDKVSDRAGCLAGNAFQTSITNCKVLDSTVEVYNEGGVYVGGLVGCTGNANITKCDTEVDIIASALLVEGSAESYGKMIGGVVGLLEYDYDTYSSDDFKLEDCTATGIITAKENKSNGEMSIGGIVGNTGITIKRCSYNGEITIVNEETFSGSVAISFGGILGNGKAVEACTASADITAKEMSPYASWHPYLGGIAGKATTVKNCAYFGTVTAYAEDRAYSGGIVGESSGQVENCLVSGEVYASVQEEKYPVALSGTIVGDVSTSAENFSVKNCLIISRTPTTIGAPKQANKATNCYTFTDNTAEDLQSAAFFTNTLGWNSTEWDNLGNAQALPTPKQ